MKKVSRFFGRKSVSRLTKESTSNRNDEDDFEDIYTEDHPPVFDLPVPIDPMVHPTLATNRETHISARVNVGKMEMKLRCCWSTVNKWWDVLQAKGDCFAPVRDQILLSPFGSLFRCGYNVADRALVTSQGMRVNVLIPQIDRSQIPTLGPDFESLDEATLRDRYVEGQQMLYGMRDSFMNTTNEYYHYLLAERERVTEAERHSAELEEELRQMSLAESRCKTKSRKKYQGEGSGRS